MGSYTSSAGGLRVDLPDGDRVQFVDGVADVPAGLVGQLDAEIDNLAAVGITVTAADEPELDVIASPVPHDAGAPAAPEQGVGKVLTPEPDGVVRSPIPEGAGAPKSDDRGVDEERGREVLLEDADGKVEEHVISPIPHGELDDGLSLDGRDLDSLNVAELRTLARRRGLEPGDRSKRAGLLKMLRPVNPDEGQPAAEAAEAQQDDTDHEVPEDEEQ